MRHRLWCFSIGWNEVMLKKDDKEILYEKFIDRFALSKSDEALLEKRVTCKSLKKDELIYFKYDCLGYVILKSGKLRAYISAESLKEITIFTLNSGESCILCDSCVMENFQTQITLQAQEDVQMLIIPIEIFKDLKEKYPLVANYALELISKKFAITVGVMEQALFSSLKQRVCSFLKKNHQDGGISITHEELANHLGSAREAISRVLKELKKEGVIAQVRGKITLLQ